MLEQITDRVAFHAEGPVWSSTWGELRFVDMLAGAILTLHADGSVTRLETGAHVAAFIRSRTNGGYVVGTDRGIALADTPDTAPTPALTLWDDEGIRMNEGGVDPWGYLYAGSMPYVRNEQTAGSAKLYRVSPTLEVSVVLPHVTTSNGIAFSPDRTRAYYNDTTTRYTDVFDVTGDGMLTNRRHFHDGMGGSPDGLTVDSAGNVWVALNHLGRAVLYSPEGEVLDVQETGAPGSTAVTLGGEDGRDLFVTVSRETDDVAGAGAVWHGRVDVPGQETAAFAG